MVAEIKSQALETPCWNYKNLKTKSKQINDICILCSRLESNPPFGIVPQSRFITQIKIN